MATAEYYLIKVDVQSEKSKKQQFRIYNVRMSIIKAESFVPNL